MKNRLFAFILAIVMSAILNSGIVYAQNSQVIGVDVPFAFNAGNKTLPAGRYRLEPVSVSRSVWRIRDEDNEHGAFLLAKIVTGNTNDENVLLTFHRYGEQSFLVGFMTPAYEIDLPTSKSEKPLRLAALPARIDLLGTETVTVEAR